MNEAGKKQQSGDWTDKFGAVASSLCAAHCAVCALAPAVFGAIGLGVLLSHEAEWTLNLMAIAFGVGALVLGWRKHRSLWVAGLLTLGIVGLLASRGLEMNSDHHGHDGEHHAEQAHAEAGTTHERHSGAEEHADEHEDGHGSEGEMMHALGAGVGVVAGMLLASGHLLNIRATRRRREVCCD